MSAVNVLAVMNSCRDRDGLLDDTGRCIEWALQKERYWRSRGMTDAADEAKDYCASLAFNRKAQDDSLRGSCRAPLTVFGRAPRRRIGATA